MKPLLVSNSKSDTTGVPSLGSVASAAPRSGPRLSRHVFADGVRVVADRDRLPGNLPSVPHVGHLRAPLLQCAVGFPPARVPRLRVERTGLAPCRARHVARVGGRRRIDEVSAPLSGPWRNGSSVVVLRCTLVSMTRPSDDLVRKLVPCCSPSAARIGCGMVVWASEVSLLTITTDGRRDMQALLQRRLLQA